MARLSQETRGHPATVDEMIPPEDVFSVGGGNYKAIGQAFVGEFRRSCALEPHHHVLDIGCGTGRIAIALTQFLSAEGRYEGFDAACEAVEHGRQRITPSYPNFHFQVADLFSERYNPCGKIKASEFRFPYADASFDLVFAASVFTHLLPEDARHYLVEAARVLKPDGHFLATWFLLEEESSAALGAGKSSIPFPHRFAAHRVNDKRVPEAAVAYDQPWVLEQYDLNGLGLTRPIGHGTWSGRPDSRYYGYQDLVVASRREAPARRAPSAKRGAGGGKLPTSG